MEDNARDSDSLLLTGTEGSKSDFLPANIEVSLPCIESERLINTLDGLLDKLRAVMQLPLAWAELTGEPQRPLPLPLLDAAEQYLLLREQFRHDADQLRASVPPASSTHSLETFDVTAPTGGAAGDGGVSQAHSNGLLGLAGAAEECVALMADTMAQLAAATRRLVVEWGRHAEPAGLQRRTVSKFSAPAKQMFQHMLVMRRQMYLRHLTTPEQESSRTERLRDVWRRDNRNRASLHVLSARLMALQEQRDTDRELKAVVVEQLERQISTVEARAAEDIANIVTECEGDLVAQKAAYGLDKERLRKLCEYNENGLKQLRTANRAAEAVLKKRKYKIESELENWLQKYDSEMTEKLELLEDMQAEFEAETLEREEYDEKVEAMRERYEAIILKRQMEEEMREAEERYLKKQEAAALFIQAFWRGYQVRKKFKKIRRKGKKGKKGGKGGGGGKKAKGGSPAAKSPKGSPKGKGGKKGKKK